MACAFCGADEPLTKEHLWSKWIRDLRPDVGVLTHVREGSDQPRKVFPAQTFDLTVRAVCAQCNNGWMHRLEERVRPFVEGMIVGRGRALASGGQTAIATWAVKTVLMFQYTHPENLSIPRDYYNQLFERKDRPPDSLRVYTVASAAEGWEAMYRHRPLVARRGPPEERAARQAGPPDAVLSTFTVNHLALQVFTYWHEEPPAEYQHARSIRAEVGQIWPIVGEFDWPPGRALGKAEMERFAGPRK